MKKYRVLALVMAMLMLALTFSACGEEKLEAVTVKCHVKVNGADASIVNMDVDVVGDVENLPTVLDALIAALDKRGEDISYELELDAETEKPKNILSITDPDGKTYKYGYTDKTNQYISLWEYTIDGVAPKEGKMNAIQVAEGQQIEFTFNTYSVEELAAAEGSDN